jgi:hypothetical protein
MVLRIYVASMPRNDVTIKFQLGKEDWESVKATFLPGETWEKWVIRKSKVD